MEHPAGGCPVAARAGFKPAPTYAVAGLIVLLLAVCLSSCGQPAPAAPSSASAISLTDALGRQVDLPAPPQRLVAAGKGVTMLLDAIFLFPEARQHLVAAGSGQAGSEGFLPLVEPSFSNVTVLAGDGGAEPIAAARPDLVLLKSYSASKLGQSIETLGLKTLYLDLETPEQFLRDLAILGQAFGETARANELIKYYQASMEEVAQGATTLSVQDTLPGAVKLPRVLLAQVTVKGGSAAILVPPAGWIQTLMVERAGGLAVWKEASDKGGYAVVNLEQVAAWDPDFIFLVDYQGDSAATSANLAQSVEWKELRAVRENHFLGFPGDFVSWDQADPRWILGQLWVAKQLAPEQYATLDLQEEAARFFQFAYGLSLEKYRQGITPQLQGDLQR
ncbi:MAG: ABC transporter substrate-binding protein [bacterium]